MSVAGTPRPEPRDWPRNRATWMSLLQARTGKSLADWSRRIAKQRFADQQSLRVWLIAQGVTGYPLTLLTMECFGDPDYLLATADELVDDQYAARPHLRPIFDLLVEVCTRFGPIVFQARRSYVSFVTPRRAFARVSPLTSRIELALRLDGELPGGRLRASPSGDTMKVLIDLTTCDDVDAEVAAWLRRAYEESSRRGVDRRRVRSTAR
jgi:uncharacterized protein DUF5655